MFKIITIQNTVRIPPKLFSDSLEDSILESLKEYESIIDKDLGIIITVMNPREIGQGKIIFGDGAAYYNVVFDALVFKPDLHEIVKGKIVYITEFGAFVRFGPIDGLIHISQVTDDFMSYNEKTGILAGKNEKKVLKKEDVVNARIIAVSMKNTIADSKINLTMRQTGLGKEEWYVKPEKAKEKK